METPEKKTRLLVIGAGPGGYPAAFLAADLGMDVTMADLEPNPGGVCLYRGCIPSKTLLHVARFLNETREAADWGVLLDKPRIELNKLRQWKNDVIAKLTHGLGVIRERRKVRFVQGRAKLLSPNSAVVDKADGAGPERIDFDYCIVATGSHPAALPNLPAGDPRIMNSDDALELRDVPEHLLVIGGGYIGLELGTVYAALGSKVRIVERTPSLLPGVDRDLVDFLSRRLIGRFHRVWLDTKVLDVTAEAAGIRVKFSGIHAEPPDQVFDKVLVSVGRRPNSNDLGLENTRVQLDPRGFIKIDKQRRTDEPTIFAIGDVAGGLMLAHKATYEARIAVEAVAGLPSAFEPLAIPAVVFTDPEIAWAGLSELDARTAGRPVKITRFPWAASGRATTLDRNDGLTKLVLDPLNERVVGVGIVGVSAGELIAEGVLAIEMGARASDLQMTIHAHPTLSETVMEAAEAFFGQSPHIFLKREKE